MDLGLKDKRAIVLASTAGLGYAVAEALLAEGAKVAISGRDPERFDAALGSFKGVHGDRVWGEVLDVTDGDALAAYVDRVRDELGGVDILVVNMGGPPQGVASAVTDDELDSAYLLLLKSAVRAVNGVLPAGWRRRSRSSGSGTPGNTESWLRSWCLRERRSSPASPSRSMVVRARACCEIHGANFSREVFTTGGFALGNRGGGDAMSGQRRFYRGLGIAGVAVVLVAGSLGAGEYRATSEAGPYEVSVLAGEWVDLNRDGREVPWKAYYPKDAREPAPVVIWSHGAGGSREGAEYLGRHLASHGYAAFHIQHHGSDIDALRQAGGARAFLESLRGNRQVTINRVKDVPFAVESIAAMGVEGRLAGRLDTTSIGMSGHSFGAITTLFAAGQLAPGFGHRFAVPHFKGAFAMSPSPPRDGTPPGEAFGDLLMPFFHLTGTADASPLKDFDPEARQIPFRSNRSVDQYLLVLKNGIHATFSGVTSRGGRDFSYPSIVRHHELIKIAALAFWDAYLTGNEAALTWLQDGGYAAEVGDEGSFEFKPEECGAARAASKIGDPDPVRQDQLREIVPLDQLDFLQSVSGDRVLTHLREMVAVGPHRRTGTAEARRTVEYIQGVLQNAGLEPRLDPFEFEAFRYSEHSLTVDGVDGPIDTFPVFYSGATSSEGITGNLVWVGGATEEEIAGADLEGAIALAALPREVSGSEPAIGGVPQRLREAGAVAAVYYADFWVGNVIAAINTQEYEGDMQLPSLLVGRRDGEQLAAIARGTPTRARLVLDARLEEAEGRTVYALLPGASEELVIVNSSYNGWFTAAVERLGSAMVLHLAEVFAALPQTERPKSMLFVMSSGHELGNIGAEHFAFHTGAEFFDRAMLFLNIGSGQAGYSLAEVDGEPRVLDTVDPRWGFCSRNDLLLPIVHNALWAFDVSAPVVTTDRMNIGETIWAAERGVPHLGIVGGGNYWHTAADTLDKTSVEIAEPIARTWAFIISYASTLPDGALRATEWKREVQ